MRSQAWLKSKFPKKQPEKSIENTFPEPSCRYSPNYDEILDEREIGDCGSFGSAQSTAFDSEIMEHPLPHERSAMAPIYRTIYRVIRD